MTVNDKTGLRPNDHAHQAPPLPHIPHIDGLRAVAIVWVLAFHYFPQVFSGGYVGVDVFFVISGYLISGIIWKQLQAQEFSFLDFYRRRIRRIFPALVTVLFVTLWLGFYVLHDSEFKLLAKHVFAAAFFLNNWVLSIEKGYFDADSEDKPLLHLWSLSIEEQFYLIWPLLLWFLFKTLKNKNHLTLAVAALAALSLLACLIQTPLRPVGAFYSPHTRIWELVLGSLLHLLPYTWRQKLGQGHALAGVLLLGTLLLLTPQHAFPGYWALLPTLAAAMLICAPVHSGAARVLSWRPMVAIGQISYPLYLWHWPLLSFAHLYWGDALAWPGRIGLILLSVLLAWGTKITLEDRLRFGQYGARKAGALIVGMATTSVLAVWIHLAQGMPGREFNVLNVSLSTGAIPQAQAPFKRHCPRLSEPGLECWSDHALRHDAVVVGDSKGKAVFLGLTNARPQAQGWIYLGANANGGAPVPQGDSGDAQYKDAIERVIKVIDSLPEVKHVVLAVALRSLYGLPRDDSVLELATRSPQQQQQVHDAVYRALVQLAQNQRQVTVLLDNPTFRHPPRCIGRKTPWSRQETSPEPVKEGCGMALDTHLERTQIYRQMMLAVQARLLQAGLEVRIVDAAQALCDLENRRCEMTLNGRYLYDFTDHTSEYGSVRVARLLLDAIGK